MKQRVTQLEEQLASITVTAPTDPAPTDPASTDPASTEPTPTESTPTESAPTEPAPTEPASDESSDMSRFLDNLLNSNNYADWLSVATCKNATLDHLLNCAQKCASIKDTTQFLDDKAFATDFAKALISNKKATSKVVKELANSEFREVWKVIASATCNDSDSLVVLAQKCASIKDTTQFLDDKAFATDFAKKLTHHSEFNAKVGIALTASPFSEVKNIAIIALESLENS